MRQACIDSVTAALGYVPSPAQVRNIETRIRAQMRLLAQSDPDWNTLPREEQLKRAGAEAGKEIIADQDKAWQRTRDNISAVSWGKGFMYDQVANNAGVTGDNAIGKPYQETHLRALSRLMNDEPEGFNLGDKPAAENMLNGRFSIAVSRLIELIEAGKQSGIWRFMPWGDPRFQHLQRRAISGEKGGDIPAWLSDSVEQYHELAEMNRVMLNAKGFNVGRLEGFDQPHVWSDRLLLEAVQRLGKDAVIERFVKGADRARYFQEDGRQFTTDELREFMDAALDSIMYDGLNKKPHPDLPPIPQGSQANRHRHHRFVHLRPDVLPEMLREFSELGPVESILMGLHAQYRDLTAVELFGPNAKANFLHLVDEALRTDVMQAKTKAEKDRINKYADELRIRFDVFAGNHLDVQSQAIANGFGLARGVVAAVSLPATTLTTVTDLGPMYGVALKNGLNPANLFVRHVQAMWDVGGKTRRWARRAGLLTDTVTGYADRLTHDFITGRDLGSKAASFTVRTSLMNWVTEARRQAFMTTAMDTIGHLVNRHSSLSKLKEDDRRIAQLLSISEETWQLWRLARVVTLGKRHTLLDPQAIATIPDARMQPLLDARRAEIVAGRDAEVQKVYQASAMMTPEQVQRSVAQRYRVADAQIASLSPEALKFDAAAQLIGILKNEMNTAIITPGLKERANLVGRTRPGTWHGEWRRMYTMFKAFPWTYMQRHWNHTVQVTPNRIGYGVGILASMWMLGIVANWLYDLVYGRDPRTVNVFSSDPDVRSAALRNITLGFVRGGGTGVLGDLVNPDVISGQPNSAAAVVAGPVVGRADRLARATIGNAQQEMLGQESNTAAELVKVAESYTPTPWYARTIVSRWLFNQIIQDIDRGALEKMQRRSESTLGTDYWWSQTEAQPDRAPDLLAPFRDQPN